MSKDKKKPGKREIRPYQITFKPATGQPPVVIMTSENAVDLFATDGDQTHYTLKCDGESVFRCYWSDIVAVMDVKSNEIHGNKYRTWMEAQKGKQIHIARN